MITDMSYFCKCFFTKCVFFMKLAKNQCLLPGQLINRLYPIINSPSIMHTLQNTLSMNSPIIMPIPVKTMQSLLLFSSAYSPAEPFSISYEISHTPYSFITSSTAFSMSGSFLPSLKLLILSMMSGIISIILLTES